MDCGQRLFHQWTPREIARVGAKTNGRMARIGSGTAGLDALLHAQSDEGSGRELGALGALRGGTGDDRSVRRTRLDGRATWSGWRIRHGEGRVEAARFRVSRHDHLLSK